MARQIALVLSVVWILFAGGAHTAYPKESSPDKGRLTIGDAADPLSESQEDLQAGQPEPMTDIYDIKPLEKIGYDKRVVRYILYALLALILIGLVIFLIDYYFRKRRRTEKEEAPAEPADTLALRMLDALEGETAPDAREFYFRLSAIMRAYLEKRFGIDALEMTNEELIPSLSSIVELERELKHGVKEFLAASDPVKFAGMPAESRTMKEHLLFVRDLVLKTKPAESGC